MVYRNAYYGMVRRCYDEKNNRYINYGARGIRVCDRWLGNNGFDNFIDDIGFKPTSLHSLDRIDVNGNYEPSNCRWADEKTQKRNRTDNRIVEYDGSMMILQDAIKLSGLKKSTVAMRISKYGWDVKRALTTPARRIAF